MWSRIKNRKGIRSILYGRFRRVTHSMVVYQKIQIISELRIYLLDCIYVLMIMIPINCHWLIMEVSKNVDSHLNWRSRIKKKINTFHIMRVWISRHTMISSLVSKGIRLIIMTVWSVIMKIWRIFKTLINWIIIRWKWCVHLRLTTILILYLSWDRSIKRLN